MTDNGTSSLRSQVLLSLSIPSSSFQLALLRYCIPEDEICEIYTEQSNAILYAILPFSSEQEDTPDRDLGVHNTIISS